MARTRYEDACARGRAQYGDRYEPPTGQALIAAYNAEGRVRVVTTYPGGETYTRTGTVSLTTGWRPAFLLMHRSSDHGSSDLLDERDEIIAYKEHGAREYRPVAAGKDLYGRPID